MAYDYKIAKAIVEHGGRRAKKSPYAAAWYEAVCEQERPQPLIFSAVDGNVRAEEGVNLTLTATAAARNWERGERAAAILSGGGLLILDKISGG
ncbi:MAG TPA: hypothetical protein H9790_07100 [Candidatus Agathobaculum intestinipullorum]|nr:hypothetical protein [Candidatus Agathobaculum intestinipullorum]